MTEPVKKPRKMENDTHMSLVLPGKLRDAVKKRARKDGVPISELVRRAIKKYLGLSW